MTEDGDEIPQPSNLSDVEVPGESETYVLALVRLNPPAQVARL